MINGTSKGQIVSKGVSLILPLQTTGALYSTELFRGVASFTGVNLMEHEILQ